jgi:hypothetical protein
MTQERSGGLLDKQNDACIERRVAARAFLAGNHPRFLIGQFHFSIYGVGANRAIYAPGTGLFGLPFHEPFFNLTKTDATSAWMVLRK